MAVAFILAALQLVMTGIIAELVMRSRYEGSQGRVYLVRATHGQRREQP